MIHQFTCKDCGLIWTDHIDNDDCPDCQSSNLEKLMREVEPRVHTQQVVVVKQEKEETLGDYIGCGGCLASIAFVIILFCPPLWIPALLVWFVIYLLKK